MIPQQCKHNYHRYSKPNLHLFCNEIESGIYTNPTVFSTSPINLATYKTIKELFYYKSRL